MELLYVTPEVQPYHRSELGEFVAEVAQIQRREGHTVTVVAPASAEAGGPQQQLARRLEPIEVPHRDGVYKIIVLEGRFPSSDTRVILLDHPTLRGEQGADRRWVFLAAAVPALVDGLEMHPDVVHALGWQTGLVPLLMAQRPTASLAGAGRVFSVIDPAQRGLVEPAIFDELEPLGVGRELFNPEGIEFHQQVSLLKAGLISAQRIVLPSQTGCEEVCSEPLGFGLHGLYQKLAPTTVGVRGGVDVASFDPANDRRLPKRYSADDLTGKADCKQAAQQALGLRPDNRPPLLLVLDDVLGGPGLELLLDTANEWLAMELQVAFVGPCEQAAAADRLATLSFKHGHQVAHHSKPLATQLSRLLLAGADGMLLLADRETGVLRHLKAMRYGAVPVASAVGSLRDSIVDFDPTSLTGTGICFAPLEADALLAALRRLLAAYSHRTQWPALVANAMRQQLSWQMTAAKLCELYDGLQPAAGRAASQPAGPE